MPWSFRGQSFAVASDGAFEGEWFVRRVERVIDAVAGSTTVYVDVGATVREPLSLVAQFTATSARDALEAFVGTTGTLADDDGRTCTALLAAVAPVRVVKRDSGIYRLAVQFDYVSG